MPFKAHFTSALDVTDPITLHVYISKESEKQTGEQLQAFLNLINSNSLKINKLIIIDTTYLHRHYDFKYSNKKQKTEWFKKNEVILRSLAIDYEVVSYATIVDKPTYKDKLKQIKKDYIEDESFKQLVNDLATDFAFKSGGDKEKAIKFILDECAGTLINSAGYFSYPGKCPAPIEYVKEKYKQSLESQRFLIYKVTGKAELKEKQAGNASPPLSGTSLYAQGISFFSLHCGTIIDDMKLDTPQKQSRFLLEFGVFTEKLKSTLSNEEKGHESLMVEVTHEHRQRFN